MTISKHLESAIDILYRAGQDDNEKARAERRVAKALAAEAALPDLLDATRKLLALCDDMSRFVGQMALKDYALFNEAPIAGRAAIAKAEGGGDDLCWSKMETQPLGSEYGWRCDGIAPCPPDPRAKAEGGAA